MSSSKNGASAAARKVAEETAELSSTSSSDSSSSGSDSDDSSLASSSASSSSGSSSPPSSPAQNRSVSGASGEKPATAKAASNAHGQQQQQQQQQQQRYVHLNPDLHFERPDNEYIPLPPLRDMQQVSTVLRRVSVDKQRYPEGRHRMLDYFRVAVEMFVTQVRLEYQQQYLSAQRNNKVMQRFTWKNSGELAICFACCCDMLKLLYDSLQPGPLKPLWDGFVAQLAPFLMLESRVPSTILTEQTYHVKYMDWQKGGTRYGGDQSMTNVRFPSAKDRRLKIETYLKSGAGLTIAVQSEAAAAAQSTRPATSTATSSTPPAAPPAQPPAATPANRSEEARPPFAGRLPGSAGAKTPVAPNAAAPRPPVKIPLKHTAGSHIHHHHQQASAPVPPLASTGVKQMPQEMKHLFWLSVLAHVKGGEAARAFPNDRLEALPGLLRLCEMTEETAEMRILMDVLAASSGSVQTVFERLGGLLSFRRFASHFIIQGEAEPLMCLVEQLARWNVAAWGSTSQQAWQTNMNQNRMPDLTWLRTLSLIPEAKRAAWGAQLLVLEQRFIFRAPRSDEAAAVAAGAGLKRPRADGDATNLRAVLSDNVDMQKWAVPRVNVFSAVRLPVELRVPPLCAKLEEDTVHFLNAKRAYAEATQAEWRARLEKVLAAQPQLIPGVVPIPVWYDPYELLSVVSSNP